VCSSDLETLGCGADAASRRKGSFTMTDKGGDRGTSQNTTGTQPKKETKSPAGETKKSNPRKTPRGTTTRSGDK